VENPHGFPQYRNFVLLPLSKRRHASQLRTMSSHPALQGFMPQQEVKMIEPPQYEPENPRKRKLEVDDEIIFDQLKDAFTKTEGTLLQKFQRAYEETLPGVTKLSQAYDVINQAQNLFRKLSS
jgi:hypothetical protein